MTKILITGKNSYIGNAIEKKYKLQNKETQIFKLSLRNEKWKEFDFSSFSTVIHVAGIVHKNNNDISNSLYYEINRDLAINVAKKAKNSGVEHFILMSTMSVFGISTGFIDENTIINPKTHYGKSKREAELQIELLKTESFKVTIIRPPMVYGKNCKGNYSVLSNFVKKFRIFPNINNFRSMIYIDNLVQFISLIVDYKLEGVFHPQNTNYVNTKEMVRLIGKFKCTNVLMLPNFCGVFTLITSYSQLFQKVIGNLTYSQSMSKLTLLDGTILNYNVYEFEETIKKTEN